MSDVHHDHHPSPHGGLMTGATERRTIPMHPIVMSIGIGLFLFVFAGMFDYNLELSVHEYTGHGLLWLFVSLSVITWIGPIRSGGGKIFLSMGPMSLLPLGAHSEIYRFGKVGMFVFLMSEMMVFTSLFSTYMRYQTRPQEMRRCFRRRSL